MRFTLHIAQPGMTIGKIDDTRRWVEEILGVRSTLSIERVGERNRVALRFATADGICECEMQPLIALKMSRSPALDIVQRLRQMCLHEV